MYRILGLLILVIDVLVILDIINSKKDNERKILWVIAVFCLPLMGPIAYYILRRK